MSTNIAMLLGEGFQDAEAFMPLGYFYNRGSSVVVIGPEKGIVNAYNSDFSIKIQKAVADVKVDDFDALIIPGGKAPAKLRENEEVVAFAREFFNSRKPVASICHGPQILARAGVLKNRKSTGVEKIKDELEEAGVHYVDEPVVVDDNYITSRRPKDLAYFCSTLGDVLSDTK